MKTKKLGKSELEVLLEKYHIGRESVLIFIAIQRDTFH